MMAVIARLWRRMQGLRQPPPESDVARELEAHVDLEAEELRDAGLGNDDAKQTARRRLGNSTLIREEIHEVWTITTLEQLVQDIRYAVRALRRNPGFTLVALLSLALGIGANTAIFTFVNAAFLKPLPYPDAERIVALEQRILKTQETTRVHPRSFVPWQERAKSFEALVIAQPIPLNTEGADGAEQIPGLWVSPELFRVFSFQPHLGPGFTQGSGTGRIEVREGTVGELILSYEYWQRRFGSDPSIVGKSVPAGRGSAVIVGVMPAGFRVGNLKVDVYSPLRIDRSKPESIGSRSFLCFGRLRPGVTLQGARVEMETLALRIGQEDEGERNFGVVLSSLRDYLVGENRSLLFTLAGVVGFVLLIACANLAALLLTRGVGRQSELAVRAALGAGRWRIIQQLSVESLVLSMSGGALGLFLGWAGSRALIFLAGDAVNFGQISDVGLDGRVLLFTFGISVLTAIAFGLLPALRASRVDLQSSVKSQGRGTIGAKGQDRVRSLLVIGEVGLAVVLLVGAGLLLRTFANLINVKLGIQPEHALTMRTLVMGTPAVRAGLVDAILERVESLPGVLSAGTIQFLPLTGMTNNGPFHFLGRPLPADPSTMESDVSTVSRGYFAAIGMEVLRGRAFGRQDRLDGPRVAVVNQAFVNRYSREEDPIGRIIFGDWANPKPTEIVGVVNDVRHNGLTTAPRPTVFLAQSQVPGYFTNLVVRTTADPAAIASAIRREVRNVDPRQPFTDVRPMKQYVSMALARPRLIADFVGAFSLLALFLAAMGIYGLLAYAVTQRTHEIGLRMALGAQPREVLVATMWQGARLVVAGVVLGAAVAFALSGLLSKFLFGVGTADPVTYFAVTAMLIVVAVIATFVPARRAASIEPIVALRYE